MTHISISFERLPKFLNATKKRHQNSELLLLRFLHTLQNLISKSFRKYLEFFKYKLFRDFTCVHSTVHIRIYLSRVY